LQPACNNAIQGNRYATVHDAVVKYDATREQTTIRHVDDHILVRHYALSEIASKDCQRIAQPRWRQWHSPVGMHLSDFHDVQKKPQFIVGASLEPVPAESYYLTSLIPKEEKCP